MVHHCGKYPRKATYMEERELQLPLKRSQLTVICPAASGPAVRWTTMRGAHNRKLLSSWWPGAKGARKGQGPSAPGGHNPGGLTSPSRPRLPHHHPQQQHRWGPSLRHGCLGDTYPAQSRGPAVPVCLTLVGGSPAGRLENGPPVPALRWGQEAPKVAEPNLSSALPYRKRGELSSLPGSDGPDVAGEDLVPLMFSESPAERA